MRKRKNAKGTPLTLDGAIHNAIVEGTADGVQERLYIHIKDFLAQRFSVAYMQMHKSKNPEHTLEELWKRIIKR
jgi:hypothetical protein